MAYSPSLELLALLQVSQVKSEVQLYCSNHPSAVFPLLFPRLLPLLRWISASIVPDLWITTHASDLFRNLKMSGVLLLIVRFLQLAKHPTDYRFVGGITNGKERMIEPHPLKQLKKNDHDNGDKNGWHQLSCAGCWNSHLFYRQTVPRNHRRSFPCWWCLIDCGKTKQKKAFLHNRTGKREHNVRLREGTKIRCYFSLTTPTNPALTQPENESVTTLQGRLQAERLHKKLWLKGWVFAFRW